MLRQAQHDNAAHPHQDVSPLVQSFRPKDSPRERSAAKSNLRGGNATDTRMSAVINKTDVSLSMTKAISQGKPYLVLQKITTFTKLFWETNGNTKVCPIATLPYLA